METAYTYQEVQEQYLNDLSDIDISWLLVDLELRGETWEKYLV